MLHGVINIKKEKGYTSHDVVAKMRGILRQKKIGHTGTLDPDATGVLPVCLGAGTRLCDMLTDTDKCYRAVMLLGVATDTQDITGTVESRREVTAPEDEVREAVLSFTGEYDQIPPMYSALKQNGKKLYELAREGKVVERKARRVMIREILIESVELPRVTMTVKCSKGTYIRTLCHDIGEKLGCGACMESLVRTGVGSFRIEDAVTLSELEAALQKDRDLKSLVIPVDGMLTQYPAKKVKEGWDRMLYNGNLLPADQLEDAGAGERTEDGQSFRIYDSRGQFCGVYELDSDNGRYRPVKMFLDCADR